MSKIAAYLAEHLRGEVATGSALRSKFSVDGSVLKITPLLVAFPYNTSDVRKIAHFAWQLAEKGHTLPVTARGNGTSRVGAAIGSGVIVSFPTHFKNILEVDTKQRLVRVQPGVELQALNQALQLHGLVWPVASQVTDTTVGGVLANNIYGEYGSKYGDVANWVDQIEVVLSNGDVIQTGKLNKRDLNKKKGLATSEGELYRKLDGLITDNQETINSLNEKAGSSGFNIASVKDKKGNFDLTPLIVGAQGTLGIITEVILRLDTYRPETEVLAASILSLDNFETLLGSLQKHDPSRLEYIDKEALVHVRDHYGVSVAELLDDTQDLEDIEGLMIVEFNESAKSKAKKATKLFDKQGFSVVKSDGDYEAAQEVWQLYERVMRVLTFGETDHKSSLPIIEDVMVAPEDVNDFIAGAKELTQKHRIKTFFTSHVSAGVVHAYTLLNLKSLTDKQKLPKLIEEYYKLAVNIGGSVAGEYGEGRLRVEQAELQFTSNEKEIFEEVKTIFDSHGIFNPDVKIKGHTTKGPLSRLNESYEDTRFNEKLSAL